MPPGRASTSALDATGFLAQDEPPVVHDAAGAGDEWSAHQKAERGAPEASKAAKVREQCVGGGQRKPEHDLQGIAGKAEFQRQALVGRRELQSGGALVRQ